MAKDNGASLCYLITLVLCAIFLVYGLMELLKKKTGEDKDNTAVIVRQLQGIGFIVLSQVVLVVGAGLCFGMSGGLPKIM